MEEQKGWKPIPLVLKILFVVFVLWIFGAVMNLSNLMESGLPLFGTFVTGVTAALIVLFLDVIGPLAFLFALWTRKSWGPKWAYFYIGLFILNSIVAFFTVADELGLPQILIPIIVSIIFIIVIYFKRDYFLLHTEEDHEPRAI